ncbi:DUF1952 domain-containing protein [Anaerolineales bacterium HSG6]|nr:DUF1952 domain-containing protein [Anaerolineales bacterium HSG6]MDM8530651.1 DUF1952 domain-containing protein [Anaerolineales bacterium HSG25]
MKLIFGIPLWLMKKYLTDLDATETEENVMVADNWQVVVRKSEPHKIGSLVVGRIEVDVSGDEAAIEAMLEKLHWKSLRGGG